MLSLLILSSSAFAWKHTGWYWPADTLPHEWWLDNDPVEDSLPGIDYEEQVLQDAWDNWEEYAPCAGLADEYMGQVDDECRQQGDGETHFYFEDCNDEEEPGVLGVTYTIPNGVYSKTANGRTYSEGFDSDIVFNDDVDFGTTEDIEAGTCNNEVSIEAVATHEIGHLWGLDHSCEDGETCTEQDLQEATMYWSEGQCNVSAITPNADDITSMYALYSVFGTFSATTPRSGGAPLDVSFEISSDAEVTGAHWQFGDGETSDEFPTVTHTYTRSGQFSVSATMELADPVCGAVSYSQTEVAYVTACTEPIPEEGADGYFQLEPVTGLTWQTVNHTDVSTYGCVDTISWEVYEGSEVNADNLVESIGAWSPAIAFPAAGTYTVLMNVGGPGGITASSLTVDVADLGSQDSLCATVPAMSGLGALAAGLASAIRRRSRR